MRLQTATQQHGMSHRCLHERAASWGLQWGHSTGGATADTSLVEWDVTFYYELRGRHSLQAMDCRWVTVEVLRGFCTGLLLPDNAPHSLSCCMGPLSHPVLPGRHHCRPGWSPSASLPSAWHSQTCRSCTWFIPWPHHGFSTSPSPPGSQIVCLGQAPSPHELDNSP